MPSKSVREMTARERLRHSLSARTFRSLILVSLIISAAAILFGYLLFSATVNREFRAEAWHLSKTAVDRLDKRALRRETEDMLAVYDSLPPEELEKNDPPPVGYTRLMRRRIRRGGLADPVGQQEIACYKQHILELLDQVDRLDW